MALIGLRGGGEHGNLVGWATANPGLTVHSSANLTGMGGPASLKYVGIAAAIHRMVFAGGTAEHSTVYFSFKYMAETVTAPASSYTTRFVLTNNGTLNVGGFRLAHLTSGLFEIQCIDAALANQGTLYSGSPFVAGQTYVISGKFVAGAAGSFEVRIDGVVVASATINTTSSHPAGTAGGFLIHCVTAANPVRNFYLGDFLFDDAAYPPANATVIARQFKAGTPTYDGFATLVGGGTKYGNISESPPSATLAIANVTGTASVAQTAFINSFSATETGKGAGTIGGTDTVLGVRVEVYAKTSNIAGNGGVGSTRLRLAGVDTDSLTVALLATDTLRWGAVKTGVALSDLNSGEAGWVKALTGNNRSHTVEDAWVVAAYATVTHYTLTADAGSYALVGSAAALDAPWTPAALGAALLGWWDADDFTSFTLEDSNTRVTQWRDAVGSYGPDQGSGFTARPIYNATGFGGRPCVEFDGVNHHLSLASVPFPTGAVPCEIWALAEQTAPAVTDTIIRCVLAYGGVSTAARRLSRNDSSGVNRARASVGTGAASVNVTDTTVVLTGTHVMRAVFSGTTIGVGVDGSALTTAAAVPATTTLRTRIGSSDGDPSGLRWQGSIAAILVTDLLTTEQADELNSWLSARIGAAAYSLDAEAGAFALTGSDAGLKVTRKVTAAAGSYALVGTAAGLRATRRLTAAAGAYALTGTAAGLRLGRKVAGSASAYLLTGTAATLRRSRVPLSALSGAYAVTGSAAGLKATRKVTAAAGSYALTGSIAGLKLGRKVTAGAGAYSLTGASAGFLTTRRLGASAGYYLLTGSPAGLIYSIADPVLTVEAGAYALIGAAAGLRAVRKVTAAAGSHALTGTAAGLKAGHKVAAAAGSYALTGSAAVLRADLRISAGAGSYALTGTAADLAYVPSGPADWTDSFHEDLGAGSDSTDWGGWTARQWIAASNLTQSGSAVRLTLAAPASGNTIIAEAYIAHRIGGDNYDFSETPVPIKVGGNTAFVIPGGSGSIVTDELPFALDNTKDVALSFYFEPVGGNNIRISNPSPGTGLQAYYLGGNDAATMDATGYVPDALLYIVDTIEVLAAGAPEMPVLAADAGSYALTGSAAVLRASRKLTAVAGSYVLTGAAAGLVHTEPHRVLAAEAGSYLIGGQPVAFIYTPVAPPIPVTPGGGGGGGGFEWPSEAKKRSKKRLSEYLARAEAELLYGKPVKKVAKRVDLKRLQEIASEVPPERLAAAREIILEAREDWRLAREAATLALLDKIAAFYAAVAERQRLALLEAAILQARRDEIAEEERLLAVLAALEYQRLLDEEAAVVAVLMAA